MTQLNSLQNHRNIAGFLKVCFTVLSIIASFAIIRFALPMAPEPIGSRAELFTDGAICTLQLTLSAGIIGILIGLILGLSKLSSNFVVRSLSSGLIGLLRGTPLLVQIFFVYFAIPAIIPSIRLNEFLASMVALAFNVGAYNAEAIRAGIIALPKGQFEAAFSLGLSKWHTMRWVILPQAFKIVSPPLLNNLVALLKDSSLASSIGLLELSLAGNRITSETFLPVPVLTTVAIIYLLLTGTLSFPIYLLKQRPRRI